MARPHHPDTPDLGCLGTTLRANPPTSGRALSRMYSEYQLLIRATQAVDIADKAISEAMATPVPTFESGCAAIKSWHRQWASADAALISSHQATQALVDQYRQRITAHSRP